MLAISGLGCAANETPKELPGGVYPFGGQEDKPLGASRNLCASLAFDTGRLTLKAIDSHTRCPVCGGWIDVSDLGAVTDHAGPLPRPAIDHRSKTPTTPT